MPAERERQVDRTPPKERTIVEVLPAMLGSESPKEETFARKLSTFVYLEQFGTRDERGEPVMDFEEAYRTMYEIDQKYVTQEVIGQVRATIGARPYTYSASALRLLYGQPGENPIESAKFFTNPQGWGDPEEICEIGRLAFATFEDFRVDPDSKQAKVIRSQLLKQMTVRAAKEGQSKGRKKLQAVMPPVIYKMYGREGIAPLEIEDAELIESHENKKLFDSFKGYWRNPESIPRPYEWDIDSLISQGSTSGIIVPPSKD